MKFFFDHFSFTSGGALGSLTLGLLVKELWKRGWPPGLAVDKGHQAAQQVRAPLAGAFRIPGTDVPAILQQIKSQAEAC